MNAMVPVGLVLLLAGCAADSARVESSHIRARDNSYTIDLPQGWHSQFTPSGELMASRDGYLLETIRIEQHPMMSAAPNTGIEGGSLKFAFPNASKTMGAATPPSDLADVAIAELEASHGLFLPPWALASDPAWTQLAQATDERRSALTVLESEPARISGHAGFRLRIAYKTERGLEMLQEVFGVTDRDTYYQLSYIAPKLHYFSKYEAEFAASVESFKLTRTK